MIRFILEKPTAFKSKIGQAIELSINSPVFMEKFAPFTLVSTPENDFLELLIKVYPEHKGLTFALSSLLVNDEVIVTDAWDSYEYRGVGTFIAGGSGLTPFIPMIRNLRRNNLLDNHSLIFANKRASDIIVKKELENSLGANFINILSEEHNPNYDFGRINVEFLKKRNLDFEKHFYLCGPDTFSESIKKSLLILGVKESNIQTGY